MTTTTTTMTANTTTATRAAFAALPVPPVPAGLCWLPGSFSAPSGCDCPRCRWEAARKAIHRDPSSREAAQAVAFAAAPSRESCAAAILEAIEAAKVVEVGAWRCLPPAATLARLDEARQIIKGGEWRPRGLDDDGTPECLRAQRLLEAARAWHEAAFSPRDPAYGRWERVARQIADASELGEPIDIAAELDAWEEEQGSLLRLGHHLVYEASRPTPPPAGRAAVSAEADACFREAGLSEAQIAKIWADNDPSPEEARAALDALAAHEPASAGPYGSMASRVWDDHWARVGWWKQFVD